MLPRVNHTSSNYPTAKHSLSQKELQAILLTKHEHKKKSHEIYSDRSCNNEYTHGTVEMHDRKYLCNNILIRDRDAARKMSIKCDIRVREIKSSF